MSRAPAVVDNPDGSGKALLEAVKRRDKGAVALLLQMGAPLELIDAEGLTALHCAAVDYHPDRELINTLLEAGADPNSQSSNNYFSVGDRWERYSVVDRATSRDWSLLELFLKEGGKRKALTPKTLGQVLLRAVLGRRMDVVYSLIAAGADLKPNYDILLKTALDSDNVRFLEALLEKAESVEVASRHRDRLIVEVARNKKWTVLLALVAKPGANLKVCAIALKYTIYYRNTEVALRLIALGVDVNANPSLPGIDYDFRFASNLCSAIEFRDLPLIVALLRAGVDTKDMILRATQVGVLSVFSQENPLNVSAYNGNTAQVLKLLTEGADLVIKNSDGDTAIVAAAKRGHWETVAAIVAWADTPEKQAKDREGFGCALLLAFVANKQELVIALLGTNPNVCADADGNNSLHLAIKNNNPEMLAILLDSGFDSDLLNRANQDAFEYLTQALPEGDRAGCLAVLQDETRAEARAERVPFSPEEGLDILVAEAPAFMREKFLTRASRSEQQHLEYQIALVRSWSECLLASQADSFVQESVSLVITQLRQKYNTQAISITPRYVGQFIRDQRESLLRNILKPDFSYLISLSDYKRKLAELTGANFNRELSDEPAEALLIKARLQPALAICLGKIESATSFEDLDLLHLQGSDVAKLWREYFSEFASTRDIPKLSFSEAEPLLLQLQSKKSEIISFARSMKGFRDFIAELSGKSFDATVAARMRASLSSADPYGAVMGARQTVSEIFNSYLDNINSTEDLGVYQDDIGRYIQNLNYLESAFGKLFHFARVSLRPHDPDIHLAMAALKTLQEGYALFTVESNYLIGHINVGLDAIARDAQIRRHRSTIGVGMFFSAHPLASVIASITRTPLLTREQARSIILSGAAVSDLPSKFSAVGDVPGKQPTLSFVAGQGAAPAPSAPPAPASALSSRVIQPSPGDEDGDQDPRPVAGFGPAA